MEGFGRCFITQTLHSFTRTLNILSVFFLLFVFCLVWFFLDSVHAPNSAITESGKVGVAIENNCKRLFEKEE